MPESNEDRSYKLLGGIVAGALILAAALAIFKFAADPEKKPHTPEQGVQERRSVVLPPVVDYDRMAGDNNLQSMMDERKETYGVTDGVDLVLKSDESIKIGDLTVTMQEIEDKIRIKTGDVLEDDIAETSTIDQAQPVEKEEENNAGQPSGKPTAAQSTGKPDQPAGSSAAQGPPETVRVYGIHIVRPGDNIWNIHFNFIKSYYAHRDISVAPLADESNRQGFSSGIGRILKFSENMVYIYNLREKKLDVNLNLIHPLTKIVVFNMQQVFALLDQVDYTFVNRIEFDGETIWIPSAQ